MTLEPITYWFYRTCTQKWRRDILSRWNNISTPSCESWFVVFLSPVFTVTFTCFFFHSLMTAYVGPCIRVSSGYTPVHFLRSNSSASFCVKISPGSLNQRTYPTFVLLIYYSYFSMLQLLIFVSFLPSKIELLNLYHRFLESYWMPRWYEYSSEEDKALPMACSQSKELERLQISKHTTKEYKFTFDKKIKPSKMVKWIVAEWHFKKRSWNIFLRRWCLSRFLNNIKEWEMYNNIGWDLPQQRKQQV